MRCARCRKKASNRGRYFGRQREETFFRRLTAASKLIIASRFLFLSSNRLGCDNDGGSAGLGALDHGVGHRETTYKTDRIDVILGVNQRAEAKAKNRTDHG